MGEATAVAVFRTRDVEGDVLVSDYREGVKLKAVFTKLPKGKHGFHIHKAGDLRGDGCHGLCEHYDVQGSTHGGPPGSGAAGAAASRHTGDLGNIEIREGSSACEREYYIKGISSSDLWGRSIIVHEDEDDLGKGPFEDSKITGHSGARMACAIFGRTACKPKRAKSTTRKNSGSK